jgi:ubiquinone/menaquinone biosynthesis C-methylase UbiE
MVISMISKHKKYTTVNPISKYLVGNFLTEIEKLVSPLSFESVLDVGCGEGILLAHIQKYIIGKRVLAIDIDPIEIKNAEKNILFATRMLGNIYGLPFGTNEFDLVLCAEVLEHCNSPEAALKEVHRVTSRYCILSIPNEPIWRFLNMARGVYISTLGNTPGHVNHWSNKKFQRFVSNYFHILKTTKPLPWIVLLCEKNQPQ